MSEEYISREAAITAACYGFCHPGVRCPETPCREQTKYLRELPSADVVQVVRCDDCKYYGSRRWCELHSSVFDDNAFCSYGERKADEIKQDFVDSVEEVDE